MVSCIEFWKWGQAFGDMFNLWRQTLRPAKNNKRQLISYNAGWLGVTRCWFRLHSHVATAVFMNRQATGEFAWPMNALIQGFDHIYHESCNMKTNAILNSQCFKNFSKPPQWVFRNIICICFRSRSHTIVLLNFWL